MGKWIRFVRLAAVTGYRWLVEVGNHVGLWLLLLLVLVGIGATTGIYAVWGWKWFVVTVAGLFALVLFQGAYLAWDIAQQKAGGGPSRLDHLSPRSIAPYLDELRNLRGTKFEASYNGITVESEEVARRLVEILEAVGWISERKLDASLRLGGAIFRGIEITSGPDDRAASGLARFLRVLKLAVETGDSRTAGHRVVIHVGVSE
jgi:hypothetical protein